MQVKSPKIWSSETGGFFLKGSVCKHLNSYFAISTSMQKIEFQHALLKSDPDILTHWRAISSSLQRCWPFGWTTAPQKHGLHKPVKLPTRALFFSTTGTKPPTSMCPFEKWQSADFHHESVWFLYLWGDEDSSWGVSGHYLGDATARGHGNGGHQMCNHLWAQKSMVFPHQPLYSKSLL